jgi:hypothetical protein
MARVTFTRHVAQLAPPAASTYAGATLGDVLDAVFAAHPQLKGYILDDQGAVRKHIAVFIDGGLRPRAGVLQTPLNATTDVYVIQALSGG